MQLVSPEGVQGHHVRWWLIVKKNAIITAKFINHEEIHERQQKEMLVLPFFLCYGLEFIFRLLQDWSWHTAYRNISFEREAYANENNLSYLPERRRFAWIHYLKLK